MVHATSWQLGCLAPPLLVVEGNMKRVSFVFFPPPPCPVCPASLSKYSLFGLALSLWAKAFSTVFPWLPEVSVIDRSAWLWQGHCCRATPIMVLPLVGRAESDRQQGRVFPCRSAVPRNYLPPSVIVQNIPQPWVRNGIHSILFFFLTIVVTHFSFRGFTLKQLGPFIWDCCH